MLGSWFDWDASPAYYDYGNNVAYGDGNVYYGDQFEATADDYYQQASDLAGGNATPTADSDWLPLGVFAVVEGNQQQPSMTVELAVDKQGTVRGNCVTDGSKPTAAIEGGIDKKTQRIAWTVAGDNSTVYETGLYNLTKEDAPGLVHFGKDRTEQLLLVRLNQDDQQTAEN